MRAALKRTVTRKQHCYKEATVMTDLKRGDTVVVFIGAHPVQHNGKMPDHKCRAIVKSVGPKWITTDTGWRMSADGKSHYRLLRLPEARELYRSGFGGPKEHRSQEFIEQCIESL